MYQFHGRRRYFSFLPLFLLGASALNGAVFTVINVNDSGSGSFRQAILSANASAESDTIQFQIPGTGPFTISPAGTLPSVSAPVVIDATTQAGFVDRPVVELNGISAGSGTIGLLIVAGNSTVRGLAISRFSGDGIRIEGNGTNVIEGNFIGVGLSGNSDFGNALGGVTIYRSRNNLIGGTASAAKNVISGGNLTGIYIIDPLSKGNQVIGNFIGTDLTGTVDRGNIQDGILISEAAQNTIGGLTVTERNVISGNNQSGIYLAGLGATENQILGNYIGTTVQGSSTLGNNENGITIYRGSSNVIGAASGGGRNLLSGNSKRGLFINGAGASRNLIQGNFIGTDISGTMKLGNAFSGIGITGSPSNIIGGFQIGARNLISGNKQSGIAIDGANSSANSVLGNFIGTDASGSLALGNLFNGVLLSSAPSNQVGGVVAGSANLISGNGQRGILIADAGGNGNLVQGNLIGTDFTGRFDLGNAFAGVWIETAGNLVGGNGTPARNVISGNDQSGVYIFGNAASNNLVQGNFIGTDLSGTVALANSFGGVNVTNAPSNLIGGSVIGSGNLISGNSSRGVYFQGTNARLNRVEGNFIGTDISGSVAIPNSGGVFFFGSPSNTVGGTVTGAANLISGNNNVAISIGDPGAKGNIVQGNSVGTKADKISPLGNQWHGIEILNTSTNNIIGGATAGAGNIIAHARTSLYAGVRVRDGCIRNSIRGNSIFANGGLGVDLSANGPRLNQVGGRNTSTNYLQNFPVITSSTGRYITTTTGTFSSVGGQSFALDFYASPLADPAGYGEGRMWLGTINVATAADGTANFTAKFTNAVPVDRILAATATDSIGNTSEFSEINTVANAAFLDSDFDLMPDEFEIAANLNPLNGSDATLDGDMDGMSSLNEFRAGTNPNDATSVLRLFPVAMSGEGMLLQFQTVSDRIYGIEFSTNLFSWEFLPNAANIVGDKTVVKFQDGGAASSPARFYRVHLLP